MRTMLALPVLALITAAPALAQSQTPGWQQSLQGLLSGNQNQDRAVQEAYERGYRRGRQDEARVQNRGDREQYSGERDRYRENSRSSPDEGRPDTGYYNSPSYNR